MILTQLEGTVTRENWAALKQAYEKALQMAPPAISQTYLLQQESDSEKWRILTFWENRQAIQEYRASVETPEGVVAFRAAGAEPTLTIHNVSNHLR